MGHRPRTAAAPNREDTSLSFAARSAAQLAAQDLAGDRLRQLIDQLDLARVLVGGHALLAVRDQFLRRRRRAGPQADERLDGLAALLVRHADDSGLADGR